MAARQNIAMVASCCIMSCGSKSALEQKDLPPDHRISLTYRSDVAGLCVHKLECMRRCVCM